MMKIKHARGLVDVADELCEFRKCLRVHLNYGTFVKGRGYIKVYKDPDLVCWTRHEFGCPLQPKGDFKCCEDPSFKEYKNKTPHSQKCRNCGSLIKGKRLVALKEQLRENKT